ncbi:PREDICTED: oxygen-regulated protein 1 [Tinamus guttatus]|uniref:oxygen-regulated protein 1 n=1 Tax=Tinamus guttatus TaxID=94827 RepID=UPI00052EEF33|nr:PREDICTED: oxygen-regulated protein 1 [Tinamus guttatus]
MSETPSTSYSVNQPNSSESEQTLSTRHFNVTEPVVAKRICFYKSGDPQFNGIKMVVNNRSYKTFDALLDSLSKRVPLPFGVRNISTPKGRHIITNLEDLEDGKSYICSHQRKMKPINLERARKKPLPWQISRPVSAHGFGHRERKVTTPKKLLVFKNGDVRLKRTIVLGKKNTQTFEAFLDYMSELMQYPVVKLYTTDGRKVPNLQALILCSGAVVAAGREPFKPSNYDPLGYSRTAKLLGIGNRVYPKANAKLENESMRAEMASSSRSQIFSISSDKGSSNDNTTNDNNSDSSYGLENYKSVVGNQSLTDEDLSVAQYEDDIEKSVHLNQDGSMTVEMKVRFKIKEEETIKWTTTVSRAGLSDGKNINIGNSTTGAEDCLSDVNISACIKPKEVPFLESSSNGVGVSLQQFNAEVSDKESQSDLKTADYSTCQTNTSAHLDVSNASENKTRPRFYRPPTPGPRRVRQKKAVVESVTLVSEKEIQEKTVGQFSYSEEIQDGESKSEYCMVAHSSSKKSSTSEMSDNDLLKLSSESRKKEEMLFKVSHKSHDLIETSNTKKLDLSDEDELLHKILEKSVVEQGAYNSLVSTRKANISGFKPASKIYQGTRPVSADNTQELHSQTNMIPACSKAAIEKIDPTTGFFPSVIESENQKSTRTESVMVTHPTDESQAATSLTKKKKRKTLSNLPEQDIHEDGKDKEVLGIIESQGIYITGETTQNSTIQATDSEMPQKKEMEYFVKTTDRSVNSDKSISPEDEICHQSSVENQECGLSNRKIRANRQLNKIKSKSGKKNSSALCAKQEDSLTRVDSKTETEQGQDKASIEKEGTHLTMNSFEQIPNSTMISTPLSEVSKDHHLEKERDNNSLENLSSKKEKKQKKIKKNLSKTSSKTSVSERALTLEPLKQEDFQDHVAEHSLENYVQSWLKNLSPNSVLPPISKKEGNLPFLKQTTIIEKIDELKTAISHFEQSTENNLLQSGRELKKQDSTHCLENMPISENHNNLHLQENENSVESCFPKDTINFEEAQENVGELESCSDIQEELYIATETSELNDLNTPKTLLNGKYTNTNSDDCSLTSYVKPHGRNEEMVDSSLQHFQDTDALLNNEQPETSVEPKSTVPRVTSREKICNLDQVTSEVVGEKDLSNTYQSKDEKVAPKSAGNDEKPNNQLNQGSDLSTEYDYEDDSVQEGRKDTETHEETSERLSTPSPLSFCYESKQITECDMSEGEQKLQVKELENRICSDISRLEKCLKSPATSDWSDYRPDSEDSDCNFRASSDLTNESGEEAALEKHYNTGYVKRTIERLYGKAEASFKPNFHTGIPYMSKVFQKNTEEFHSTVVERKVSSFEESRSYSAEKLSLPSEEFPENINKDDITWRRENISLSGPQVALNGEETTYTNDCSGEPPKQCCQPSIHANEDEGILIDKGKWLLKENHLIRQSPPERIGMYGNLDSTSTDTMFDTNSEDAPYSHFGNLTQYPALKEISSSELEDMVKPSENVCNYFNIPHNSDSDPFLDDLSTKSKPSLHCKTSSLPIGNKEKINPSVMECSTSKCVSTGANTSFTPLTPVEFRLPDNKVHPLKQPLNDEPIQSQPNDVSNANRSTLREEDSLDKLHAICGQHCPILMAIVTPVNEEQRGYVYQKASDLENQLGLYSLAKKGQHLLWSCKDLIKDENNYVTIKNNCISKIANNIFNRFYANNTLDFISNLDVLKSSTSKERSNLGKFCVIEDMEVNPVKIHNCRNSVFGKWKVSVLTSDIPSAGTSSQVYITLYGDRSSSGPIFLDGEERKLFQRGNEDIFTINTGNLGDLFKIRIGHTNAGNFPAWHCDEVRLLNLYSGEQFYFPARRWLTWDQGDGEICLELPVLHHGQPVLPVTIYEVHVTTGELWNAGTEADVYISIYGEKGDTGSRQLHRSPKPKKFLKGQTDNFPVEAVHLGHLYKIVIGHNGLGSGNGWFLDKVVIKDPITDLDYTFFCHRWLDHGQDDGKIARELTVTDSGPFSGRQELRLKSEESWAAEKWKFQEGNKLQFYNRLTRGFICLSPDGKVDALGDKKNKYGIFDVIVKRRNIYVFSSHQMPHLALAVVSGYVTGKSKGETHCELCVHMQPNRCAILESARNPGHTVTFSLQGKVADETTGYAGLSKEFVVHVKGTGDEYCHFKIEHNLESGSVSLESVRNKGIYVGLLPDGQAKPVIHTGERNILFYPQVIKFGREKPMGTSAAPNRKKKEFRESEHQPANEQSEQQPVQKPGSQSPITFPPTEEMRNPQGVECPLPSDDEWKVSVLTGNSGTQANVILWIYGDRGVAGPITLVKDSRQQMCLSRQENEFQIKIKSIGNIYKIRIEHERTSDHLDWKLQRLIQPDFDNHIYTSVTDFDINPMALMVSAFEVGAVSLGKLQKVLLRCEANTKSQYWYCDKVIVREAEKNLEYVFCCERWLPFMSQGVIHSEIELYPQEFQINSQLQMQEEANEGEWKITVVTGDFETAGTTATVSLYAYGENKASGPIILGSGKHQLFNPNSADTFKINLRDLGQLYKIRIGHDNTGDDPGWYLEEVRLQRVVPLSDQEICLPVESWLAEDKDDGDTWREVAIKNPTKELLPLVVYEIHVYTGFKPGAETDSNVYINLIGTRGDTGKRKLHRSKNNNVKFLHGQMDIFFIKAVSLGDLEKVLISHDGTGPGNGWFLDKIVIKHEEGKEAQEVVFPCNRWLDEYQDDGRTQRELTAEKYSNSKKEFSKGQQWRVQVQTDGDSPEPQECKRTLVIYGSKGKSDDLLLSPRNPGYVCFLPKATDEFIVETGDVGNVYKIRVSCDDMPGFEGWHLKSFHIEELHTKQELNFDCSCWLSLTREDRELVKEFPAVGEDGKTLPVYKYVVSVHIGDRWGAETFANVWITLYGKKGDTGVRKLHTSLANGRKFQRNKVDSFLVEAVSLGHLQKVVIQHDGEGYGAGMYLKMITVREFQDSDKEWVFPCCNWIDTHLGLCGTACEILTVGKRLISSPKLPEMNIQLSGLWIMDITGSDLNNEVDPIHLSLIFYGDLNHKELPLQITGKAIQIQDELTDIGSVYKVQVMGPHSKLKQPWHLDLLHMKHTATNEEMYLAFDCWFNPNEDKCVELPALYADQEPLPVVEYSIHLHTGDLKKADATGEAYLCIQGERSNSGKRWLNSRSSLITFARGQVDTFKIKAVYLGKLNQVLVGFKSPKKDDWFLEKIVIKEGIYPFSTHIFVHNNWINKRSKKDFVEVIIPLKETSETSPLTKEFDMNSQGRWQMWVDCIYVPEDVPDIQVVIFGKKGKSSAQKVQNLNNNPFLLSVGDIGDITKVSFLLSYPCLGRGIKLQKLRLKDLDTNEDLSFYTEAQSLFGEDGSATVTELAAVRPDKTPLREVLYSISVHTGTLPASGTDAEVFITIFGEKGDSCRRRLRHSNFERGQVSRSELKAIDLGLLSEVLVEHSNVGYGAGWYLDHIIIHESGKTDGEYVFLCQQWLDSGVGDTQMKRMLRLLGKVRNELLTGNVHGTWDVFVTTTDVSSSFISPKMSLTVCDETGTCNSVTFPKESLKKKQIYETSIELSKKFSTIHKVRLEIEESGEGGTWHCCEVKLQHRESKNILEFPFSRNFADGEGLTVAELPVLTAGLPFPAVKNYVLYITTGTSPGSGTDADVFVMLKGPLGDTGRRKLVRKGDDNFTKGKVDVFQVEAVDLGTLQGMVVEKGKGSDWFLEKIIVKESVISGTETLFVAQTWLKDKGDGKRPASVTLNATVYSDRSAYGIHQRSFDSNSSWLQCATASFVVAIDAVELGELDKVILLISSKADCKLDVKKLHLKEALKEDPIYVFEVNEDKRKNGIDNNSHIEGGQPGNLAEYTIKVYTGDKRGAGTDANVHIILFGNEDKSEVFQLSQSLEHQDPFERGRVDTFKIMTKKIGSLHSIEIGHDGKGFASGWFLEKVEITDVSNSVYYFNCNRWLAEDEGDGRTVVKLYP